MVATSSNSSPSCTPVTIIVWGVCQLPLAPRVKVTFGGETVTDSVSLLSRVSVKLLDGSASGTMV